jgi:Uma2 family endonuclease
VNAAMNEATPTGYYPLVIHSGPALQRMNNHEFFEFCQANPELRIERTSEGDLIIMPPATTDTGRRNFNLTAAIARWAEADGTGGGLRFFDGLHPAERRDALARRCLGAAREMGILE